MIIIIRTECLQKVGTVSGGAISMGQAERRQKTTPNYKTTHNNNRKKIFKTYLLETLDKKASGKEFGQQKGSQLYCFNKKAYDMMKGSEYPFQF